MTFLLAYFSIRHPELRKPMRNLFNNNLLALSFLFRGYLRSRWRGPSTGSWCNWYWLLRWRTRGWLINDIIISVISLSCAAAIDLGGHWHCWREYGSGEITRYDKGRIVDTKAPQSLTIIILSWLQCCSTCSLSSSWGEEGVKFFITVENNGRVGVTDAQKIRWKINSHINSHHSRLHQQHHLRQCLCRCDGGGRSS